MRLHACASLHEDGSIVGKNCPPGIVVSGPSVVSPTHSDVRVHFEIESPASFDLSSEIVSDNALRQHGAVLEKAAPGDRKRSIDHQVHVFEATPKLEARVSVLGAEPVDFRISGLELRVQ
jgi:hypothetical protein